MKKLFNILLMVMITSSVFADTHYVAKSGSHSNPYTTWATAATNIHDGFAAASSGDTILVGEGVWNVTSSLNMVGSLNVFSSNNIPDTTELRLVNHTGSWFKAYSGPNYAGGFDNNDRLSGFALTADENSAITNMIICQDSSIVSNCIVKNITSAIGSAGTFITQENAEITHCSYVSNSVIPYLTYAYNNGALNNILIGYNTGSLYAFFSGHSATHGTNYNGIHSITIKSNTLSNCAITAGTFKNFTFDGNYVSNNITSWFMINDPAAIGASLPPPFAYTNVNINNNTIINNHPSLTDETVVWDINPYNRNIWNATITNNYIDGMFIFSDSMTLHNSVISDNTFGPFKTSSLKPRAVIAYSGNGGHDTQMYNVKIQRNKLTRPWNNESSAQALIWRRLTTFKNVLITDNYSTAGAPFWVLRSLNSYEGPLLNCTIANNYTTYDNNSTGDPDKRFYVERNRVEYENCIVYSNTANGVTWWYASNPFSNEVRYTISNTALNTNSYQFPVYGSANPQFADSDIRDYHLKSQAGTWDEWLNGWVVYDDHSIAIDAGDPTSDFTQEPFYNGQRINIGYYGNTPKASKSVGGPAKYGITTISNKAIVVFPDYF